MNIVDLLLKTGLRSSKSDVKRLLESGGIYVNGVRWISKDSKLKFIGKYMVLRIGKKEIKLIK